MVAKICYITAIYGSYESSCKKIIQQTIESDCICFTDNPTILRNGWKIDTTPYHILNPSPIDTHEFVNSLNKNKHTFNIAKYYKQAFQNIPCLKVYDCIIWLDGTIEIINSLTSEYILSMIYTDKIITWNHERRNGSLLHEMNDSRDFYRYSSTHWNNQDQPYQDVNKQYEAYINNGYDESYFKKIDPRQHFGVWLTCFIAFLTTDPSVSIFLDMWYTQTLQYTTQDQIGFPYTCQKTGLLPYTLPDSTIKGDAPHSRTSLYIKHDHGR